MSNVVWSWLFKQLPQSGCAKKQTAAATLVGGVLHHAVNRCEFVGDVCPRLTLPSGQGYELCAAKHAEANLAQFCRENGWRSDGIAWVAGHYWACEPCAAALKSIGVTEIRVRESEQASAGASSGKNHLGSGPPEECPRSKVLRVKRAGD